MKLVDYCNSIVGDGTDREYFKQIIMNGKYDAVINWIRILNQNAEEDKSNAVFLNSYLPHLLPEIILASNKYEVE